MSSSMDERWLFFRWVAKRRREAQERTDCHRCVDELTDTMFAGHHQWLKADTMFILHGIEGVAGRTHPHPQ